ncbi:MAG: winged helix-turn-helix transcriptional regulator [Candidatus Methylarchaceae archaeon HK02M1]|nr:winged helix-turn-helix transcriptional regulator [Candidatus Methylarchaceae archaeon HK02M1]
MVFLRDKGEFTKFQILLKIMQSQPHVKQKDIADELGITIQAISKQLKGLIRRGMVEVGSESANYRLTPNGLEKLHEDISTLEKYVARIKKNLRNERVWPAIAAQPIKEGDEVGLMMRNGVLYAVASNQMDFEAFGKAVADADLGEDVGLRDLRGQVKLNRGRILIVKLPNIKQGGSRSVDLEKVHKLYEEFKPDRIGVMGTVGRAILNMLNLKADLEFGVTRVAPLTALRGLNVFVLAVGRMVNEVIEEISNVSAKHIVDITYSVEDVRIQ